MSSAGLRAVSASSSSATGREAAAARPSSRQVSGAAAAAAAAAPTTSASSSSSLAVTAASRSRHSLYGTDDRIILDLGSKVWKVGFSGESAPRAVFDVGDGDGDADEEELWNYAAVGEMASTLPVGAQGAGSASTSTSAPRSKRAKERALERRVKRWLRRVYYDELMTDPKARKVIVLENPMLPTAVKQSIARILFEHLSVPSVSFALSPLCALLSIGRITGLVVDVGNLETCTLPIYSSRPLFPYLRTSPLASKHLRTHLHALLERFSVYTPSATAAASAVQPARGVVAAAPRTGPAAASVLTPVLVEEIKTRVCFVMPDAADLDLVDRTAGDSTASTSTPPQGLQQKKRAYRINSDSYNLVESDIVGQDGSPSRTQRDAEREYIAYEHKRLRSRYRRRPRADPADASGHEQAGEEGVAGAVPEEATDLTFRLKDGKGTLTVPGWLRHACTDCFFDPRQDVDLPSVPELVLDTLLKLPIDLRKVFISNILLVGGGSMLPGFPIRLANTLHLLLHREKRYIALRGLSRHIAIINGGLPTSATSASRARAAAVPAARTVDSAESSLASEGDTGSDTGAASGNADEEEGGVAAFSWERGLLPWVGASLVGALKAGGNEEWTREAWDMAAGRASSTPATSGTRELDVGDWTRRGW